jgi:uncharacterized protein YkwD
MKQLLTILLVVTLSLFNNLFSQTAQEILDNWNSLNLSSDISCWQIDAFGCHTLIDCKTRQILPGQEPCEVPDEVIAVEVREMSQRLFNEINKHRKRLGIHTLVYDSNMEEMISSPWNQWQASNGKISHGSGDNSSHNRSKRVGIGGVGECCASSYKEDTEETCQFLEQYKGSPLHWNILMDDDYHYISVSTVYVEIGDIYYSVVNVRR